MTTQRLLSAATTFDLSPTAWNIRQVLVAAARARAGLLRYRDVIVAIDLPERTPGWWLRDPLQEITRVELAAGRPPLTAIVVGKKSGVPGAGFWEFWENVTGGIPDRDVFLVNAQASVFTFWGGTT